MSEKRVFKSVEVAVYGRFETKRVDDLVSLKIRSRPPFRDDTAAYHLFLLRPLCACASPASVLKTFSWLFQREIRLAWLDPDADGF